MKELYRVEGVVNRGFVGQITYTVCLEEPLKKLDIHFAFDASLRKFRPEDITADLIEETKETCREKYGLDIDDNRARDIILGDMKTEIHTLATLNDAFIGCIHRQLSDRHMLYDGDTATEGCIPQKEIDGVLKVTVLAFNVIKDGTRYILTVEGE
ncbi:MAG: hypothetical protein II680_13395 [Clostridia bacterium]|nr:hypothetical protein [Clostridia bacterium]MBQ3956878.1 hypothetical protein [Clostridia bacterium]